MGTPARAPHELGVSELAAAYRAGTLTPTDAVEACLAQCERVDGNLRSFQAVYAEEARAAAAAATEKLRAAIAAGAADALPLMFGIPLGLKDIIDVAGKVTTAGSATRLDHTVDASAPIARHLLEDSGGILVGKLKTVEFARGGYGTNQRMGTPVNPWTYPDTFTHLVPGGSSSGSGVSVASFQLPCAVGTDTGGSVRLPAAFCGTVGTGGTARARVAAPPARGRPRARRNGPDLTRARAPHAAQASRPRRTCCRRTASSRSRTPSTRPARWRGPRWTARSCAAR